MSTSRRIGPTPSQRVAVLRALQLGDLLCAVPALRALRAGLPEARITLIGLPWAQEFVSRFDHLLDDLLVFPGWPGLPEREVDPSAVPTFLLEAQSRRFDLVLQLHGDGTLVNPLAALLRGRQTAGYFLPGSYCPDPERFLAYPDDLPEVRRHLRLVEFLGLATRGEALEFPLSALDEAELATVPETVSLDPRRFVCLHPGARAAERRWDPAGFAAVGASLADLGLTVVLTGSPEERRITAEVAAGMSAPSIDLAGRTTLGALAALVARSALVVCNDTGVSHLADALDTPSVVIFTASDADRWAPLDRLRHRVVHERTTSPADVLAQARALLEAAPAGVTV